MQPEKRNDHRRSVRIAVNINLRLNRGVILSKAYRQLLSRINLAGLLIDTKGKLFRTHRSSRLRYD
jgi:hypothetical protein